MHGGAASQVRNAAQIRLVNAADRMARELLRMAVDGKVSDSVKLAAIKDALDRSGLGAKTEVEITAKPYETILETLDGLEAGSRSDHRRSIGVADEPPTLTRETVALPPADADAPVDAEIVDEGDELVAAMRPRVHVNSDSGWTRHDAEHGAGDDSAPGINPLAPRRPPASELMPYDQAVIAAAEHQRQAAREPGRGYRALPPVRS